jgi:hypothetical protein
MLLRRAIDDPVGQRPYRAGSHGYGLMMRTGWFKAVHIKGEDSQKLRTLMGSRRLLAEEEGFELLIGRRIPALSSNYLAQN